MIRARRPGRAPALAVATVLLGVLAAGCSGASGGGGGEGGRSADRGTSDWVEGATAESIARTLHVEVPSTATHTAAAHRRGSRTTG